MSRKMCIILFFILCCVMKGKATEQLPKEIRAKLSYYNVSWATPSCSGSMESMPLGNGDITVNAWVEQDGDLMLYIGKSDTWSEATRLLKVGRVRISLSPNPFAVNTRFLQVLDLGNGEINITSSGGTGGNIYIKVWVDANQPVVRVDIRSEQKSAIRCTTELMRPSPYTLQSADDPLAGSFRGVTDGPLKPLESADRLLQKSDRIVWVHRNENSLFNTFLTRQNVPELINKYPDPYLHRTFGAALIGKGMFPANDSTLVSERESNTFHVAIYSYTAQTASLDEWENGLNELVSLVDDISLATAYEKHQQWWDTFWNRSWIFLSGDEDAEKVTRAYLLQRFMMACQGRGSYPVKFNGGTLTFDYEEKNGDYRRWGPGYWFQNCRLLYWPLLASGDFDLMQPWFDMYMKMLPLQKDVTRLYYGHEGAFFPETLNFFGLYIQDDWGWDNPGKASQTRWIRYHYSGALELLVQMLDYYEYTCEEEFARNYIVPLATEVLRFFGQHWPRIGQTFRFIPANSLEQFWDCLNPVDYIAGLKYNLSRLKALPAGLINESLLQEWVDYEKALPALPTDGKRILPAEEYGEGRNFENPECYTIFPFRLYGLGLPEPEVALATYQSRIFKSSNCWSQDAIQAVLLGLSEEARHYIVKNAGALEPSIRFPAFWKPGSDYVPDLDNGGVIATALQYMLLNNVGKQIQVLPALPASWNVDFKLKAYGKTTVRIVSKGHRILKCSVSPQSRKADIIYL